MKKISFIIGGLLVIVSGTFAVFSHRSFEVGNDTSAFIKKSSTPKVKSTITGTDCINPTDRSVAVMVSSDPEARPLSGIGQADIVFEMPVTPGGVTRMMAVFQCESPREIGSVRSARLDFVPLVQGLGSLYAHFGGEHTVLDELDRGIVDNINGLRYDGTIYYRKLEIARPHNAFTNLELIKKAATQLKYTATTTTPGYPHETTARPTQTPTQPPQIYANAFTVNWRYDANQNAYLRTRNNRAEVDKNTGDQVAVKNLAVLKTKSISMGTKDYIRIITVGSGSATIYKNGQAITGTWEKQSPTAKLYFYDADHREIPLTPGNIWVEYTI